MQTGSCDRLGPSFYQGKCVYCWNRIVLLLSERGAWLHHGVVAPCDLLDIQSWHVRDYRRGHCAQLSRGCRRRDMLGVSSGAPQVLFSFGPPLQVRHWGCFPNVRLTEGYDLIQVKCCDSVSARTWGGGLGRPKALLTM